MAFFPGITQKNANMLDLSVTRTILSLKFTVNMFLWKPICLKTEKTEQVIVVNYVLSDKSEHAVKQKRPSAKSNWKTKRVIDLMLYEKKKV